jgi:hypothetical protein
MLGSCRLYCNLFKTADGRSTIGVVETAAQRRLDPRKQRTMEALLAAAQVMFSERPVEVVTVRGGCGRLHLKNFRQQGRAVRGGGRPSPRRRSRLPGPYPAAAETAALLSRRVDEQNARTIDAIQRGIADGSIRHLDPNTTATILWASWNGIISLAWRQDDLRQDPEALVKLINGAADFASYGLRLT